MRGVSWISVASVLLALVLGTPSTVNGVPLRRGFQRRRGG
jgi:hypothetical protein